MIRKKSTATKAKAAVTKVTTAKAARKPANDEQYEVVLREGGGTVLTAQVIDRVLYPRALAWNRLLSTDQGRQTDQDKEAKTWRAKGHETILELAAAGEVARDEAEAFIIAAAKSGIVQVEMQWRKETSGWAARVFPWEALLALATKNEREQIGQESFVVVRVLTGGEKHGPATNPPSFVITGGAEDAGFDFKTEQAAINEALQGTLRSQRVRTLEELGDKIAAGKPSIVHLVLYSDEKGMIISAKDAQTKPDERLTEKVAEAVAAHGPDLVVFSSCYTGRRLAPLAVAKGARVAIGFHGEVMDTSIPVFFGAFYRARHQGAGVLDSLRAGLAANLSQANPHDLGTVTLWSAEDLIQQKSTKRSAARLKTTSTGTGDGGVVPAAEIEAALPVICTVEEALNYSVLHNSRGGLFKVFAVTKIKEGKMDPLEVTVRLDTGLDRPAECHFFAKLPAEADRQQDLAANVTLPLGSQLLRQRGEALLGTVEVVVRCGAVQIFHRLQSIKLLPCDEWRDDETGRHLLPSFVFPRDPAVRDVLTAAQPFLRALCDQPTAGFDGYQCGFTTDPNEAVTLQSKAIWAALQHTWRLDYVNPPPSYARASQRLRIPEEILRARRGTCIELALLLASCWEHVGIFPVIFLTKRHAFAGYWISDVARSEFIDGLGKLLDHARTSGKEPTEKNLGGKRESKVKEPWMLAEPHHLATICGEVRAGHLVPLETTFIPLQRSFAEAMSHSREMLMRLPGNGEFDGMLDVQTAREKGVTPLAIIAQGIVA